MLVQWAKTSSKFVVNCEVNILMGEDLLKPKMDELAGDRGDRLRLDFSRLFRYLIL